MSRNFKSRREECVGAGESGLTSGACLGMEGEGTNVRRGGGVEGGVKTRGGGGEKAGGGVKDGAGEKDGGGITGEGGGVGCLGNTPNTPEAFGETFRFTAGGATGLAAGATTGLMAGGITGLTTGAATGAELEAATGFCTACAGGTIPCIGMTARNASFKSSSLHPPPPINVARTSSRVLPLANSARMYDISSGVIIKLKVS
jgi:hypothetical protein